MAPVLHNQTVLKQYQIVYLSFIFDITSDTQNDQTNNLIVFVCPKMCMYCITLG